MTRLLGAVLICGGVAAGTVAVGCGESGEETGSAPNVPAVAPPPAPEAIADARAAVREHCAIVAGYLAGRRAPPTAEEFDRVSESIDRLAARAELSPQATSADGSTPRLALGDIAEDLEGSNCDSRLVKLIDDRLATLPPG